VKHLLALLALCVPALGQQGEFVVTENAYLVRLLGPGDGAEQIPPPMPGMSAVEVGVEVTWNLGLEREVAPLNGALFGTFTSTVTESHFWRLTAGPLLLAGSRARVAPMSLAASYAQGTVWDGLLDYLGPTAQRTTQVALAPRRVGVVPLAMIPDEGLYLSVLPGLSTLSTATGIGHPYHRQIRTWSARVSYRYF